MTRTNPQGCQPTTLANEVPIELQRIIFKDAAKQDVTCALNLSRVALYVHDWVQPVLYERIVVQSPHAAECLLRTIRSKTPGCFKVMVKSLAFASCVASPKIGLILEMLSSSVTTVFLFRESDTNTVPFLDALKTGSQIREIIVISKVVSNSKKSWIAPNCVPTSLRHSLTHLALIQDAFHPDGDPMANHYANFFNDPLIALLPTGPRFPNLESFAVSYGRWTSTLPMRVAAPCLRCFAILEPPGMKPERHENLIKTVKEKKDRRFVVIKDYGDPMVWSIEGCYRAPTFWSTVESLVDEGCASDHGERWD